MSATVALAQAREHLPSTAAIKCNSAGTTSRRKSVGKSPRHRKKFRPCRSLTASVKPKFCLMMRTGTDNRTLDRFDSVIHFSKKRKKNLCLSLNVGIELKGTTGRATVPLKYEYRSISWAAKMPGQTKCITENMLKKKKDVRAHVNLCIDALLVNCGYEPRDPDKHSEENLRRNHADVWTEAAARCGRAGDMSVCVHDDKIE